MSNRSYPLVFVIGAAVLMGSGAGPAKAGAAQSEPCRIIAPRYEPKTAHSPQSDAVRWLGGAKLSRPLAAPCPPSRRPVDA